MDLSPRGPYFVCGRLIQVDTSVPKNTSAIHPPLIDHGQPEGVTRVQHRPSRGFFATVVTALLAAVTGCGIEALPEPEEKPKRPVSTAPTAPLPVSQARCEEIVKSVLDQLAPEKVGLSSDTEGVVRNLRDWSTRCGGRSKPVAIPAAFKEALSESQREILGAIRMGQDDFESLREASMFNVVSKVIASHPASDLERIASVLGHVTRTLSQAPADAINLPFIPTDRYLIGLGSPRDRLAVFAGILRQLRFDVAVVDLAPKVINTAPVLMAGVVLNGELALYDVELGVPFTRTPGDLAGKPVTLNELQGEPDLLKAWSLSEIGPSRIDPARLSDPRIHIIGTAAQWSSRLQDLQSALAGEDAIVAADVLGDSERGPGLIQRLAKATGGIVSADAITPWGYLPELLTARQKATEEQQRMLFFLTAAWGAPLNMVADEQGQPKVTGPTRAFLRLRLALASGGFDEALAELPQQVILPCRASRQLPLPNEIRFAHEDAANEASYWMGLAQYDLAELGRGDFRVAGDSADRYLRGAREQFAQLAAGFAGAELNRGDLIKLTQAFEAAFAKPGDGQLSDALEKAFSKSLGKPSNDSQRTGLRFLESAFRRYGAIQFLKARSLAARNDKAAALEILDAIPGRDPVAAEARFWRAVWSGKSAVPNADGKPSPETSPAKETPVRPDASKPDGDKPSNETSPDKKLEEKSADSNDKGNGGGSDMPKQPDAPKPDKGSDEKPE